MRAAALADWEEMDRIKKEARRAVMSGEVGVVSKILFEEEEDVVEEEREKEREREEKEKELEFVAHVPLLDEEIKKKVLEKKKQDLIKRYVTNELKENLSEARDLLNIRD